jgi:tetratricopeptide (TPR) repeat protein
MRLKILVMPYSEANPVGKNADYFFIKGFKYSVTEDYAHAMAAYLKGLDIKSDHLLCRFNLGVILFKLGLYHEASSQYSILASQGYSDRTFVMYNKALSELQAAQHEKTLESSQKCIAIIIKKKKANQSKL